MWQIPNDYASQQPRGGLNFFLQRNESNSTFHGRARSHRNGRSNRARQCSGIGTSKEKRNISGHREDAPQASPLFSSCKCPHACNQEKMKPVVTYDKTALACRAGATKVYGKNNQSIYFKVGRPSFISLLNSTAVTGKQPWIICKQMDIAVRQ